jgi:hypothetical protein
MLTVWLVRSSSFSASLSGFDGSVELLAPCESVFMVNGARLREAIGFVVVLLLQLKKKHRLDQSKQCK